MRTVAFCIEDRYDLQRPFRWRQNRLFWQRLDGGFDQRFYGQQPPKIFDYFRNERIQIESRFALELLKPDVVLQRA